jgi:hypothetical protein
MTIVVFTVFFKIVLANKTDVCLFNIVRFDDVGKTSFSGIIISSLLLCYPKMRSKQNRTWISSPSTSSKNGNQTSTTR